MTGAVMGARDDVRRLGAALLLARMAAWTLVLSVAARVLPLPRAMRLITPRRRGTSGVPPARLARLANRVTGNCWKRAALLHRYLLLAGVDNRVVFGVRRAGESLLDGHAWVEVGGEPFSEPAPPEYHVTFVYP